MAKQFLVLFVRVELITAKVVPEMLLLRLAKLMGFTSRYVGITVYYRGFLYVQLRHADNKDDLNRRSVTAVCEFITESRQIHRRPDSRTAQRAHPPDSYDSAGSSIKSDGDNSRKNCRKKRLYHI
jgi:hypothetical protein